MSKKLSYTITVALIIVSCGAFYFINEYIHHRITDTTNYTLSSISLNSSGLTSDTFSEPLKTYEFIKAPDKSQAQKEFASFEQLKTQLNLYIESLKKSRTIISASVYLNYLGKGSYMDLNSEEKYTPGSMFKVLNLLYYLKLNEQKPGLLEHWMFNSIPSKTVQPQTFNSKQIEEAKEYTIKELLRYMIAYSDNRATYLLKRDIDYQIYMKMVNDLKIPMPRFEKDYLFITASQFSDIFKIMYNSSYLSLEKSEFALNLLSQCDFKLGLLNGLPDSITVAHKFGEAEIDGLHQLHECGLVYLDNSPYLITIMTKGSDIRHLPPVLSKISKMVYDDISQIGKNK